MGEVYKARDPRLNRIVAIKILPFQERADFDRRRRLEREARAVAALSHPHICPLFDIGHCEGTDFLVMEFLDGETLAQRLSRGKVPVNQALEYGIQIADALAAAHKAGIIHRDLKPGNIMLTKGGAKLLDFGLAKPREQFAAASPADAATGDLRTATGMVLGTMQDMAPEQLEGRDADVRSDVFALGAVLYEMLAGRRAFEGGTTAGVVAAILERDPERLSIRQPAVAPGLDHLITTCLAKDPDNRWQTARDVTLGLKWAAQMPDAAARPVTAARSWSRILLILATALVAAAVPVGMWRLRAHASAPVDLTPNMFQIVPPPGTVLGAVAVSPDGESVAFIAAGPDDPGRISIYVRERNSLGIRRLEGMDDAAFPFWSSDSRSIAFFARNKLRRIAASGGPTQVLCDTAGEGGTWSGDTIIFAAQGPLQRTSATGSTPTPVTTIRAGSGDQHAFPSFLPDGRHFLFYVRSERAEDRGIYVGSLDSREVKRVTASDLRGQFAPPSHLLFVQDRTLLARPFDLTTLQVTGDPVSVAAPVAYVWQGNDAAFSVSSTGVLTYESADYPVTELVWFDRTGRRLGRVGEPGDYLNPWLSPDERLLVYERIDPNTGAHHIWKLELARSGNASRLTLSAMGRHIPILNADGSRMAYSSRSSGHFDMFVKDPSQPEREQPLLVTPDDKYPADWSRDGRFIIYETLDARTKRDLWVLPLFGDRQPQPLLRSEFNEQQGQLSPDGRWLAYVSDESGRWEVYIRRFPELDGLRLISTAGGSQPHWRRDGREIFYLAADRSVTAVALEDGATLEPTMAQVLFRIRGLPSGVPTGISDRIRFCVAQDGQRFLINSPIDGAGPQAITVATKWPALLRGR